MRGQRAAYYLRGLRILYFSCGLQISYMLSVACSKLKRKRCNGPRHRDQLVHTNFAKLFIPRMIDEE